MATGAPWEDFARCIELETPTEWFFAGPSTDEYAAALEVCRSCLVRLNCAQAGRGEHGLWGGEQSRPSQAQVTAAYRATLTPARREERRRAARLAAEARRAGETADQRAARLLRNRSYKQRGRASA